MEYLFEDGMSPFLITSKSFVFFNLAVMNQETHITQKKDGFFNLL